MSRIVTYCDRKAKVVTVISFAKHGYGGAAGGAAGGSMAGR